MTTLEFWNQSWIAPLVNHMWQSTVVMGIAWLLALALRRNHARTRYWVWMIASLKLLVPFSLLIGVGAWASGWAGGWLRVLFAVRPTVQPTLRAVMEQIAQPFPQTHFVDRAQTALAAHRADLLPLVLLAAWAGGLVIVVARWAVGWRRVCTAAQAASPLNIAAAVPVLSSPAVIEPGIFGIFRPVLLLPDGILNRLTPAQLDAIVAHEMCHVRRRDNLTFALHMVVEALFWFYPAVWWIGERLIEERERACDESVVQSGGGAEIYAEGILNVCKFCVESPLACVAGVTGSDLKRRIVRIMAEQVAVKLDMSRKLLLSAIALMALAAPVVLGLVRTQQIRAQTGSANTNANLPAFEVASIKSHQSDGGMNGMMIGMRFEPDGVSINGLPLNMLVREAFNVSEDRILNEPGWVKSARYDIEAKVDPADAPKFEKLTQEQRWAMMLPVLEDRFGLKFHHETKELEVYTLVIAKGGPKLQAAKPVDAGEEMSMGQQRMGQAMMRVSTKGMTMEGHGVQMPQIVRMISLQLGSTVVDKTGLTGAYDYTLEFAPQEGMGGMMRTPGDGPPGDGAAPPPDAGGPSLFAAVQEQLGLKLEPEKAPVDAIVIDHIEQPSPN